MPLLSSPSNKQQCGCTACPARLWCVTSEKDVLCWASCHICGQLDKLLVMPTDRQRLRFSARGMGIIAPIPSSKKSGTITGRFTDVRPAIPVIPPHFFGFYGTEDRIEQITTDFTRWQEWKKYMKTHFSGFDKNEIPPDCPAELPLYSFGYSYVCSNCSDKLDKACVEIDSRKYFQHNLFVLITRKSPPTFDYVSFPK